MKTYVVWIEMNEAKVFNIKSRGPVVKKFHRHEEGRKNCEKFFHEIAGAIQDADEILLMGPSLTKDHFKSHLERHHHQGLANKVVGMLTLDIQTDPQLMARSRKFFKKSDLFDHPINA